MDTAVPPRFAANEGRSAYGMHSAKGLQVAAPSLKQDEAEHVLGRHLQIAIRQPRDSGAAYLNHVRRPPTPESTDPIRAIGGTDELPWALSAIRSHLKYTFGSCSFWVLPFANVFGE